MKKPLTPAQQAQQANRNPNGTYRTKHTQGSATGIDLGEQLAFFDDADIDRYNENHLDAEAATALDTWTRGNGRTIDPADLPEAIAHYRNQTENKNRLPHDAAEATGKAYGHTPTPITVAQWAAMPASDKARLLKENPSPEALDHALADPDPTVRRHAAANGRTSDHDHLAHDPDPTVRETVAASSTLAIAATLVDDPHPDVAENAEAAIEKAQDSCPPGYDPDDDDTWDANRKSAELFLQGRQPTDPGHAEGRAGWIRAFKDEADSAFFSEYGTWPTNEDRTNYMANHLERLPPEWSRSALVAQCLERDNFHAAAAAVRLLRALHR